MNSVSSGLLSTAALIIFLILVLRIAIRQTKSVLKHRQNDIMIIPIAIIFSFFVNFNIENGAAFSSTYMGISFWIALATLCSVPISVLRSPLTDVPLRRKTNIHSEKRR